MRPIDGDNLRGRVCEIFLCAEPVSAEERHFALILGLIDSEHTITPPPNDPLTLEELREMDGEPVWVVNFPTKRAEGFNDEWAIVSEMRNDAESVGTIYHFENYGDCWLAYRRKMEEEMS